MTRPTGWTTPGAAEAASASPAVVRWRIASRIVDDSGAVELIEQRLGPRRSGPAPMPVRVVLATLVMALLDGRQWQLRAAHEQLVALPLHVQLRHGMRRPVRGYDQRHRPNGVRWSYRSMARRFMAIANCMEESAEWARRHGLELGETPDDTLADNVEFVRNVCDRLLAASLPEGYADTTIAVDATMVPAWMHRGAKNEDLDQHPERYADPDPRWRGRANEKAQFGYSAHTAVGRHDGQNFIVAIELAPGSAAESPVGLDFVKRLKQRRPHDIDQAVAPNLVITDRGYTRDHAFHEQLRGLGVNTLFDLNDHHRGNQGLIGDTGTRNIDSWAHCPATPEGLWDIGRMPTRTDRITTQEEMRAWFALRKQRAAWEMVPHEKARPDGSVRTVCPAEAGNVVCPLKVLRQPKPGAPVVLDPPDRQSAPRCCTQRTVRIPAMAGNKPMLPLPYASEAYLAEYRAYRAWSESLFARVKDPSQLHMSKGSLRLRGLTRTRLLFALACAVLNLAHEYRETRESIDQALEEGRTGVLFIPVDTLVGRTPNGTTATVP